jgi:hypothetical protein
VNTFTAGRQFDPSIAAAANGEFVVVWYGYGLRGRFAPGAHPISATRLLIRDNVDATKRKLVFLSNDAGIDTSPGTGIDPVTDGATLLVYNTAGTGDAACFTLAGGWTSAGDPASPSLRYTDSTAASGPCKSARVQDGKLLKVSCQAKVQPIDYSLDEAAQVSVAVRFASGTTAYCATFDGASIKRDSPGQFLAAHASARGACPTAPRSCP